MSMTGHFVAIRSEQLDQFCDDPDSVEPFMVEVVEGRMLGSNELGIDKAWHGIHFLLTGDASEGTPPLGDAVMGGTEIGEDMGYGPARYLTAEQVAAVSAALEAIPRAELAARYSPAAFSAAGIYPGIWDEGDEALGYLLFYYDQLVNFYKSAAANEHAVLQIMV